jgi:hypothetical protein
MSRRETFLESAKAANDQALSLPPVLATDAPARSELAASLATLLAIAVETNRRLQSVERALRESLPATREHAVPKVTRSRAASTVVWALAAALATLLAITLLRPEWALLAHQRAELLLGQRLYQRLQHMEEPDRLEVLKSLWADRPPTND